MLCWNYMEPWRADSRQWKNMLPAAITWLFQLRCRVLKHLCYLLPHHSRWSCYCPFPSTYGACHPAILHAEYTSAAQHSIKPPLLPTTHMQRMESPLPINPCTTCDPCHPVIPHAGYLSATQHFINPDAKDRVATAHRPITCHPCHPTLPHAG